MNDRIDSVLHRIFLGKRERLHQNSNVLIISKFDVISNDTSAKSRFLGTIEKNNLALRVFLIFRFM